MKAKLYKVLDQYHLYDGDKAIATTIVGNPMLLPNLSKENCDEIFGVFDVEKLADDYFKSTNENSVLWRRIDYKAGFNKAMEFNKDKVFTRENMIWARDSGYTNFMTEEMFFDKLDMHNQQPKEIDVEIEMECLDPNCDGIDKKGVCIPGDKPKLDSSGFLVLRKL
jgi:hypothetical protein